MRDIGGNMDVHIRQRRPPPALETERLLLRPPEVADLEGYLAFARDREATRYVGGLQPPGQAWRQLCAIAGSWALYGYGPFSVIEKATGRWIGRAGPWTPVDWPGPEFGWCFLSTSWGRGLAIEACRAAVVWVRQDLGWVRMIHSIDARNLASIKLARRLGSTQIIKARLPPPHDHRHMQTWGRNLFDLDAQGSRPRLQPAS